MTVVLAMSSAVLALNGALEAAPPGGVGGSFAMEAVVGALESAPSEPLYLQHQASSSPSTIEGGNAAYLAAIRVVFPIFDFLNRTEASP